MEKPQALISTVNPKFERQAWMCSYHWVSLIFSLFICEKSALEGGDKRQMTVYEDHGSLDHTTSLANIQVPSSF